MPQEKVKVLQEAWDALEAAEKAEAEAKAKAKAEKEAKVTNPLPISLQNSHANCIYIIWLFCAGEGRGGRQSSRGRG